SHTRLPSDRRRVAARPPTRGFPAGPVGTPLRYGSAVLFAAFSTNGERLGTANGGKTPGPWVGRNLEVLAQALGLRHQGSGRQAGSSPDRRLVVMADTHTSRVGDAATGEPVRRYRLGNRRSVKKARRCANHRPEPTSHARYEITSLFVPRPRSSPSRLAS